MAALPKLNEKIQTETILTNWLRTTIYDSSPKSNYIYIIHIAMSYYVYVNVSYLL